MTKEDMLKEKLIENRHNEQMAFTFGAVAFATLSAALAYGAWQHYGILFTLLMIILIVGFSMIAVRASQLRRKRKELIEKLDDNLGGDTPKSTDNTNEPTNREIMDEIKKSGIMTLYVLEITLAVTGIVLLLSYTYLTRPFWFGFGLLILSIAEFVGTSWYYYRR